MILWTARPPQVQRLLPAKYKAKSRVHKDSIDVTTILAGPELKWQKDSWRPGCLSPRSKSQIRRCTAMHKDIRNIRGQLNDYTSKNRHSWHKKTYVILADSINKKMTEVEKRCTRPKPRQPGYSKLPIRLNDKIGGHYSTMQTVVTTRPPNRIIESFNDLAGQADLQLNKFRPYNEQWTSKFNEMIHDKITRDRDKRD